MKLSRWTCDKGHKWDAPKPVRCCPGRHHPDFPKATEHDELEGAA